jgi:hypothetical protein
MNHNQIHQDITEWIKDFVETPHPLLNNWPPCPYARQARLQGTVDIQVGTAPCQDLQRLTQTGLGQHEVVILVYDPVAWPLAKFRLDWMAALPATKASGLYVLEDHPSELETVRDVVMNHGQYAILFVQMRKKLELAAQHLAARGYYHGWDRLYLDGLFEGREDPTA